eukprot:COSAG05_NODE_4460_length_1505_cov_13.315789_1_plen_116_part_00
MQNDGEDYYENYTFLNHPPSVYSINLIQQSSSVHQKQRLATLLWLYYIGELILVDRSSRACVLACNDEESAKGLQLLSQQSRVHVLLLLLLPASSQPVHLHHNTQHHANQVWPSG